MDECLTAFMTILVTKHEDAILLFKTSPSYVPELLDKIHIDVRTIWDYDGRDVNPVKRDLLRL